MSEANGLKEPKAFACPHCQKETVDHYHPKEGSDVACPACLGQSPEQFETHLQRTDPSHREEGKRSATWPDEWPWDKDASREGSASVGTTNVLVIAPSGTGKTLYTRERARACLGEGIVVADGDAYVHAYLSWGPPLYEGADRSLHFHHLLTPLSDGDEQLIRSLKNADDRDKVRQVVLATARTAEITMRAHLLAALAQFDLLGSVIPTRPRRANTRAQRGDRSAHYHYMWQRPSQKPPVVAILTAVLPMDPGFYGAFDELIAWITSEEEFERTASDREEVDKTYNREKAAQSRDMMARLAIAHNMTRVGTADELTSALRELRGSRVVNLNKGLEWLEEPPPRQPLLSEITQKRKLLADPELAAPASEDPELQTEEEEMEDATGKKEPEPTEDEAESPPEGEGKSEIPVPPETPTGDKPQDQAGEGVKDVSEADALKEGSWRHVRSFKAEDGSAERHVFMRASRDDAEKAASALESGKNTGKAFFAVVKGFEPASAEVWTVKLWHGALKPVYLQWTTQTPYEAGADVLADAQSKIAQAAKLLTTSPNVRTFEDRL